MPSHPDRIRKQYEGMCRKCLKNPTHLFASDIYLAINRTSLCRDCQLALYFDMSRLKDVEAFPIDWY
jgi:hypothetical protein